MPDGQERTERPTPRRLQKARQRGDRPRSAIAACAACWLLLPIVVATMSPFARWWAIAFAVSAREAAASAEPLTICRSTFESMEPWCIAVVAWLVAAAAAVASSAACGGLGWSPSALRWTWPKLSPAAGARSLFSLEACVQTAVALCAVSGILAAAFSAAEAAESQAGATAWQQWVGITRSALATFWWRSAVVLAGIAIFDVALSRRRHAARLKMTLREVRDERAEQEGKPEAKARRRGIAVRRSRRLRAAAIKRAAAVVVNPDHVAVALEYAPPAIDVPLVVSLGAGPGAGVVRTAAAFYGVPIVRSPELARALFARVDVDEPIPEELYAAVAAVFAWIVRTRGRLGSAATA